MGVRDLITFGLCAVSILAVPRGTLLGHGFPSADGKEKAKEEASETQPAGPQWQKPYSVKEVREILSSEKASMAMRRGALDALEGVESSEVKALADLLVNVVQRREYPLEIRRKTVSLLADSGVSDSALLSQVFAIYADAKEPMRLRKAILTAWGDRAAYPKAALPTLIKVLTRAEADLGLRRQTAYLLRNQAIPDRRVRGAFLELLRRSAAAEELRRIALEAVRAHPDVFDKAIPVLIKVIHDDGESLEWRRRALATLEMLPDGEAEIRVVYLDLLRSSGAPLPLREKAATALQKMEITDWEGGLGPVVELVLDSSEPVELRMSLLSVASRAGAAAAPMRKALVETLLDPDQPRAIRTFCGELLKQLPAEASDASRWLVLLEDEESSGTIEVLALELARRTVGTADSEVRARAMEAAQAILNREDGEASASVKRAAIEMVGEILPSAEKSTREAIARKLEALLREQPPAGLRTAAASALGKIANTFWEDPSSLSQEVITRQIARFSEWTNAIATSQRTGEALSSEDQMSLQSSLQAIESSLQALRYEKRSRWWHGLLAWTDALDRPWAQAGLVLVALLVAIAVSGRVLVTVAPKRVVRLNEALGKVAIPVGRGRQFGLNHLLMLSRFERYTRVLDAWLEQVVDPVRKALRSHVEAEGLGPYVRSPIAISDRTLEHPDARTWQDAFSADMVYMVIHGDRGTGKTVLTAQIAQQGLAEGKDRLLPHRVLPIWLNATSAAQLRGGGEDLLARLYDEVKALVGEATPFSPNRFQALLRQSRFLLIADGFSEWSRAAREKFVDAVKEAAVPRVVLTTRSFHDGEKNRTHRVETLRLDGAASSRFIEGYLEARGMDGWFTSSELFEASRDLANMMSGRTLPAQVVRIYTEFLIQEKEQSVVSQWPQSLTEVMVGHLRHLNWRAGAQWLNVPNLERFFRLLAWLCTRERYCAGSASLATVHEELSDEDNLAKKLNLFLECGVLRTEGNKGESIAFVEPPLAEYLAAYHAVVSCDGELEAWKRFFEEADAKERAEILDFLQAVEDCCFNAQNLVGDIGLPEFVRDELDQRIGINDAQKEARLQKRVYSLLKRLLTHDVEERNQIIGELKQIGPKGKSVVPHLLETFRDRNEDLEVRQSAIQALGALESATPSTLNCLLEVIGDRDEHLFFRIQTLEVLSRICRGEREVISVLGNILTDSKGLQFFRSKVADTFGAMGEHAREAVPYLDQVIEGDTSPEVQSTAKRAREKIAS